MKDKNELINYLLVGLLVVGAYFLGSYKTKYDLLKSGVKPQAGKGTAQVQQPQEKKTELTKAEWEEVIKNPFAVKGKKDAPVTIVEFTDYQCPYCSRYFEETYKKIVDNYISKGKVRYILRNLPLSFHKHSKEAAVAAYCAGKEGKYWEMHDKLFANQKEWEGASDVEKIFDQYGKELGLKNMAACMKDRGVEKEIGKDLSLAQKIGANGTPTFFINGKMLVGAQPFTAFKTMIEEALGGK